MKENLTDQSILNDIRNCEARFDNIRKMIDVEATEKEIASLTELTYAPDFWQNVENAQKINKRISALQHKKDKYESIKSSLEDVNALREMLNESNVESETADIKNDISDLLENLKTKLQNAEVELFLDGPYDNTDAIITIRAGVGGVDAADFVSMLYRMYTMYAKKIKASVSQLSISYGEEAGIKSVTFKMSADNIYGKMKAESGTHRLVRISPFNAQAKRQTSFAAVEVVPYIEEVDQEDIVINDDDIKIDTYRSSGPGGQSVNTTDSAVRLTHIPTGIVISIQNEKSQLQNKEVALKILKSQLLLRKKAEQKEELSHLAGNMTAAWGDHIRSYVLNPYQMVKDLRSEYETSNVQAVLDGDLNDIINSVIVYLHKQAKD